MRLTPATIIMLLIGMVALLVACMQSERVETDTIRSVSFTPRCPTCSEIDASVSPGCFSSSKTKPISQNATVQIDQQQRMLTFTGHFVYENLWVSGPYNADCGGAGYADVPVGALAPGTYIIMAGTQKLGSITVPEAGPIPWQQVEISPTPNNGASTVNDSGAALAPTSYLSDTISLYKPEEDYIQGAPVLGVVIDRQGQVIAVEPKGAAAQAGIVVGDTIVEFDGTPFAVPLAAAAQSNLMDVPAMQAARSRIAQGQPLKLTLSRAGQQRALDVQPANRVGQPGQATPTPVPADQLYM